MTPPPRHAQPSALAALGWAAGLRWAFVAVLAALAIGAAATLGSSPRHAAAAVPKPVLMASTVSEAAAGASTTSAVASTSAPATTASTSATAHDDQRASSLASDGIPTTALQAYQDAARRERTLDPACGLSWPLLAGIGRVESDHGRFAGAVLHTDGVSTPKVIGIPLDGNGTARITDTDNGRLDGDRVYDRAVGPMQFIPSTWAAYRADGNGDGVADPFNIFDAAAAAAHYLCSAGGDLTTLAGQLRAVHAYNDSDAYVTLVLQLEQVYARGVPGLTVPIVPTHPSAPGQATVPPVNPGPPLGAPKKHPKKRPSTPASSSTAKPSPSPTCPTPSDPTTATDTGSPTGTTSQTATRTATGTPTATTTAPRSSGTSCPTPTPTRSTSTSDSSSASAPGSSTTSATTSSSSAGTSAGG